MRMTLRRRVDASSDDGVTLVIVAICLVAIFAMVALTVDVGGLLVRRRAMVAASDAASLAAAQSCFRGQALAGDPETKADELAHANVDAIQSSSGGIVTAETAGCNGSSKGHVTVQYLTNYPLFFASVLGLAKSGTVTTKATAAWGPLAGGYAIPIVLQSGQLQGVCKVPDGAKIGDLCAFWYDNNDTLGDANWGFMNLDLWNVAPSQNCFNAGSSSRSGWIAGGYPDLRNLNGTPPGTSPTYVCNDTGHSSADWSDLNGEVGKVKIFPVNDCAGQLDTSGSVAPCPATPDKYDIIGFTSLLIKNVYKGDDPAAIGSAGLSGSGCTKSAMKIAAGQSVSLNTILSGGTNVSGSCPSSAPDNIPFAGVHVYRDLKKGGTEYVKCAPGFTTGCDYVYDESTHTISWIKASSTNKKVVFDWSFNGTAGACGVHQSDPNAICLVTEWRGFTTGPGPVGGGANFGPTGVALCNLTLKAGCPDKT
jgi:Flp pilus assembly protein TadG